MSHGSDEFNRYRENSALFQNSGRCVGFAVLASLDNSKKESFCNFIKG